MQRRSFLVLAPMAALLGFGLLAQTSDPRPYVVLVSLDGFRYDYAEKFHATNLLAIGKAGAAAEGMIPSFPSVTFPNHITIVTGQYPEHHGIVGNSFWDPTLKAQYAMGRSAQEPEFYSYKPLWVVAEQQKVKSASMFWPTADAAIGGVRPSYWQLYDGSFPNEKRVAKVLEWLKLPESERPHFITLYFSDVDSAGHSTGTDSPETEHAVQRVDKLVGDLWTGIQGLSLPVNLIVVADHGMQTVEGSVNLTEYTDLSKVRVVTDGPVGLIYAPDAETREKVYSDLKGKSEKFDVYRRKETPERWHFSENERCGDLVVCLNVASSLVTRVRPAGAAGAPGTAGAPGGGRGGERGGERGGARGAHGFDPSQFKTMQAIFYAAGPNVRPGVTVAPFENIHVFPFVAKILGLQSPAGLDGREAVLASIYRK